MEGPDITTLISSLGITEGGETNSHRASPPASSRRTWRSIINGEEDDLTRLGYRHATDALNGTVEAIKTAAFDGSCSVSQGRRTLSTFS